MSDPWSARGWSWRLSATGFLLVVLAIPVTTGFTRIAQQQTDVAKQYSKLCAPCHGATGRGDGPAAVALTPRPMSFVDSTYQASRTDEELVRVITDGKPPMPTFGKQLSARQIRALVAYIRTLGEGSGRQRPSGPGAVPSDSGRRLE